MPPSVRIESKAWDDPAFQRIADAAGLGRAEFALILCGKVWAHCTEGNDPRIDAPTIDALVRMPGFAGFMRDAGLLIDAKGKPGFFFVRGAFGKHRNRISWLDTKRKNSRKGGEARASLTGAEAKPIGSGSGGPKRTPDPDPSTPVPVPVPEQQPDRKPMPAGRASEPPVSGYQETIDLFDRLYRDLTGGQKPTWGPIPGRHVKRLLKAHGADVVQARIRVLFESPPSFLSGTTPDIATLVQHFDKLAPSNRGSAPNGNYTAADLWRLAQDMKARGE